MRTDGKGKEGKAMLESKKGQNEGFAWKERMRERALLNKITRASEIIKIIHTFIHSSSKIKIYVFCYNVDLC